MTAEPGFPASECAANDLLRNVVTTLDAARAFASHHWLISLDEDAVLRQARGCLGRAHDHVARRPLEGMLVAIKDQLDVAEEVTTCGTGWYARRAYRDAEAVSRLRAAGAIVFGKANMHELGLGPTGRNRHHGDATNPWDPARDAGGSSSGSAALVAAGVTPLALGTDLGGSVRIPASFCGVPALKPTFGAISTAGVAPVAPTMEHVGLIGRDIEIVRRGFCVLAGASPAPALVGRLPRVGICDDWWGHADADTRHVTRAAIERLSAKGRIELHHVRLPSLEHAGRIGAVFSAVEASRMWAWALQRREATRGPGALGAAVRIALAVGGEVTADEMGRAAEARAALGAAIDRVLSEVDVIASPTTDAAAPPYRGDGAGGEIDEEMLMSRTAFTMPFNLTGLPAVQVPCGFDAAGMPVGLQLVGRRGADLTILDIGAKLEAETERRIPRVSVAGLDPSRFAGFLLDGLP